MVPRPGIKIAPDASSQTHRFVDNLRYARAGTYQRKWLPDGEGHLITDPKLANPGQGDYRPLPGSPAIGSSRDGEAVPEADFGGRPYGEPPEIGAYAAENEDLER